MCEALAVIPNGAGVPSARCPGAKRHAIKKCERWGGEVKDLLL